jgi:hypothetical protein
MRSPGRFEQVAGIKNKTLTAFGPNPNVRGSNYKEKALSLWCSETRAIRKTEPLPFLITLDV